MFARCSFFACFLSFAQAAPTTAGFTLTMGSATVSTGSTTTVDVMISGGPELLDFFVTEFRIVPVGSSPAAGLQFSPTQTDFSGDANYTFVGNTAGLVQSVTQTVSTGDTLTVIDGTTDFAGVDVSATRLLTRLGITALPGLIDDAQYRIELIGGGSSFFDPDFNEAAFSSSAGVIDVRGSGGGNTVVPAPAGIVLLVSGLFPLLAFLRMRSRVPPAPA